MRTTGLLLLYAAFAALGTSVTFRPTIDSGFAAIQTERGDGMLNHLILENSWLALTQSDYCGSFLTPPFCYPERHTIYYSENLFGAAPLYWALRVALPHDLAYVGWQMAFCACDFVAFAVAARWFGLAHVLALCGAYLWAYATVHMDQIKHSQMIGRVWMPFAVYYAHSFVAAPTLRAWNRLLGTTFLQCLTCFYTGWFLIAALGVFLPALAALRRGALGELKRFVWARRGAVGGIAAFWALAMAALFVPYLVFPPTSGHEYKDCFNLLPTPTAWISPAPGTRWAETLDPYSYTSRPQLLECWLFCGFGVYALMLGAALGLPFLRRDANAELFRLCAAGLITAAVWWLLTISTAPDGDSLWRWVRHLPGGRAVRVVARVYVVVYLFGTLAGLAWLQIVAQRLRFGWRMGLLALVTAGIVWEQTAIKMDHFRRVDFYPLVDRLAGDLRGAEVGYVMPEYADTSARPPSRGPYGEVFAMWVGLRANVPVVNGYSGVLPPNFIAFARATDDQIRGWLRGRYRGTVRVLDPLAPGVIREVEVE
jgi:hypothetical protein